MLKSRKYHHWSWGKKTTSNCLLRVLKNHSSHFVFFLQLCLTQTFLIYLNFNLKFYFYNFEMISIISLINIAASLLLYPLSLFFLQKDRCWTPAHFWLVHFNILNKNIFFIISTEWIFLLIFQWTNNCGPGQFLETRP